MLKTAFLAVALSLLALTFPKAHLPPTHALVLRADAAAEAVAAEVPVVYGDLSPAEQEKRGRVAMVFGFYESAWQANPKGSNDNGAASSFLQVHMSSFPKGTFGTITPEDARADLRVGVRVGLIAMRYFETKCGSLRSALTAFATNGECPKTGWTIPLVLKRCALAGGC